jgi:hypothetical protein
MQRLGLLVISATFALAACGSEEPQQAGNDTTPAVETETSATPDLVVEWIECRNERQGYSISYPKGWYTDALTAEGECAFFDPEPFEIVADSEFPPTALEAHEVEPGTPYEDVVDALADPMFETVRLREDTEVAGLPAVLLETVATGEGLYDKGTVTYGYLIDGPRPFLVKTTIFPGDDADEAMTIVDDAAGTLRFFEPEGSVAVELPPAVEETRVAIAAAAHARDYAALEALIPESGFTYTYGGPAAGGPVGYWRELEARGEERPLAILAALLEVPHTRASGIYVWPFAYDRDPASLTETERRALSEIVTEEQLRQMAEFGHYLGWRAGIRADGTWIFYVAGD